MFSPVGNDGLLEMCWCEEKCFLGQGAFGRFFKGKWKLNAKVDNKIEVAVKKPTGPNKIEYEVETLKKANRHRNILRGRPHTTKCRFWPFLTPSPPLEAG